MASRNGHRIDACTGTSTNCKGEKYASARFCRPCLNDVIGGVGAGQSAIVAPPLPSVAVDREKQRASAALSSLRARYDEALLTIAHQEAQLLGAETLHRGIDTFEIKPKLGSGTSEATVVALLSDWHVEERVDPGTVSGLNTHDVDISKARATRLFQSIVRLTNLLKQDVRIDHMVLALLGDFISNDIHEEFPEINEQQPMHALVTAQTFLISGIEFILQNFPGKLTIPCHSGNHARTTRTTRFGAENGHSLEYLLYCHLDAYFRHEPRVTFIIPEGMHSYVNVYDTLIRFQHGHAIKYGGGVGGIYIPVNKAIAQWNKAKRVDLDCFGHFHQLRDGGNFICNGSLIGYNSFALSIKADYEQPKQALFLIDKKRGRTCLWPVIVSDTPKAVAAQRVA